MATCYAAAEAPMGERVEKLTTLDACERLTRNARDLGYRELEQQAKTRSVQLKSEATPPQSQVEWACLRAGYASEEAQSTLGQASRRQQPNNVAV